MEKEKIKSFIKQFILYGVVAVIATLIEWALFFLLNGIWHWHYSWATILAYAISTFSNWFLGRIIVYHSHNCWWKELFKIYVTAIISLALNLLVMFLLTDILGLGNLFGLGDLIAKTIATCFTFVFNFLVRKWIIYKNASSENR